MLALAEMLYFILSRTTPVTNAGWFFLQCAHSLLEIGYFVFKSGFYSKFAGKQGQWEFWFFREGRVKILGVSFSGRNLDFEK